jgi:hypothetical protein
MRLLSTVSICIAATLTACGWGDPGFVRNGDYECDAAEALVRHLANTLPDPDGSVPNEYCIVKLRTPTPVDPDFTRRFADSGKTFVEGAAVSFKDELGYPVNPKSGLAPIVLHLAKMHIEPDGSYLIDAAWAHKMTSVKASYRVAKENGSWQVTKK